MLSTLKWKTLESRRMISRLSMLYKMLYRLVSHEDAKLQSAGHSYSTLSIEYCTLTHSQQPLGITTSILSTQGQLQNGTNSQGIWHCPIHWLLLKMQFQTFINTFITLRLFQSLLFSFCFCCCCFNAVKRVLNIE